MGGLASTTVESFEFADGTILSLEHTTESGRLIGRDGLAPGDLLDARVPRSADEFIHQGALLDLPRETVFAATASYEQNLHLGLSLFLLGWKGYRIVVSFLKECTSQRDKSGDGRLFPEVLDQVPRFPHGVGRLVVQ